MTLPGIEKNSAVELPRLPDITGLDGPVVTPPPPLSLPSTIPIRTQDEVRDPTEMSVDIVQGKASGSPSSSTEIRAYPDADQLVERTFGGYRLDVKIGQGGMGVVYKGRQVSLDRMVAIKILNKALYENKEFIRRFEREAKSIARINHPNIVAVYDFGVHDGLWFMVNEFIEGHSLAKLISERLVVPVAELLPLICQSLAGLAHVGLSNIVHRDIKPDNILITKDGIAKIADFGLAKDTNEHNDSTDLTAVGLAMGTPAYMSPEQCMGRKLDGRSDQYSLGVTAYLALTGEKPFTGQSSFEVMTKQREHIPPFPSMLNPAVPQEISQVVMRMLAKAPEDRYFDAEVCRHAWLDAAEHLGLGGSAKTRSGEHEIPGLRARTAPVSHASPVLQRSGRITTPLDIPPARPMTLPPAVTGLDSVGQATSSGEFRMPKTADRRKSSGELQMPNDRTRRGPVEPGHEVPAANSVMDSRIGSERYRGPGGATCPRCGHLNRPEVPTCVRCGAGVRGGDSATAMRDQLQEAQRLTDQGHHRDAATIWARLADQETDRRQRSILRAKEREVRKADLDRQMGDVLNRARSLVDRGDLAHALEILEQGQRLVAETTTNYGKEAEPALITEVTALRRRLAVRRWQRTAIIVGIIVVVCTGAAVAWWQQGQRWASVPVPEGH